jgi:hypothetical protein
MSECFATQVKVSMQFIKDSPSGLPESCYINYANENGLPKDLEACRSQGLAGIRLILSQIKSKLLPLH